MWCLQSRHVQNVCTMAESLEGTYVPSLAHIKLGGNTYTNLSHLSHRHYCVRDSTLEPRPGSWPLTASEEKEAILSAILCDLNNLMAFELALPNPFFDSMKIEIFLNKIGTIVFYNPFTRIYISPPHPPTVKERKTRQC